MWRFILANQDIRHGIVTFRSHGMQDRIWDELRSYGGPPASAFAGGITNVADEIWERHNRATRMRQMGKLEGPLTPDELRYVEWKGEVCKRLGYTILVDDKTEHVFDGCVKYGIKFIHPDDL